ncbi:MAG: hypothetical protein GVY36_07205, partial [Verrucomicrobia bacterium]|nr:hypothetical protein [Verrucomicrobiota bacterium]
MKLLRNVIPATFLLSIALTPVSAETININMFSQNNGSSQGVTVTGSGKGPFSTYTGSVWNNYEPPFAGAVNTGPLVNSSGDTTSVELTSTTSVVSSFSNGQTSLDALKGYLYTNSSTNVAPDFTFTGLDSTLSYDLYIAAQGDKSGQGSTFTIGSDTLTATGTTPGASSYIENTNFVKFENVQADGSGNLEFTWEAGTTTQALNSIQLV